MARTKFIKNNWPFQFKSLISKILSRHHAWL